jgi:hypothetical protein
MNQLRKLLPVCLLLAIGCATTSVSPPTRTAADDLPRLAVAALAGKTGAIAELRHAGQPGLDALLAADPGFINDLRTGAVPLDDPRALTARAAIDAVAKQRDAFASGLYWYTDLNAAEAEAARSGRRVLSLRLLGNLDEEYSCANSRFFRTVLYANAEVSRHLREHYVLHWKSVRPAPMVTIDMGDGRRIKRTITGNSIHYVLDADGTVLDAIPGLYGPVPFLAALEQSESVAGNDPGGLQTWHVAQANALRSRWLLDAIHVGVYGDDAARRSLDDQSTDFPTLMAEAFPTSEVSGSKDTKKAAAPDKPNEFQPLANAKSMVERPISRQTSQANEYRNHPSVAAAPAVPPGSLNVPPPAQSPSSLAGRMSDPWWEKLAALAQDGSRLDRSSRRMMIAKLPRQSVTPEERAAGGVVNENSPFTRTLHRFEEAIAEDTVHNEFLFHIQIHQWLAADPTGQLSHNVEAFNKRVYTNLFLTPDFDQWLGLVPDDTYTALEKDGCACDKGAPPMR